MNLNDFLLLINSADEAIVEISGGADPLKAIKGMYAEIDKILKVTDFPINLYDMDTEKSKKFCP